MAGEGSSANASSTGARAPVLAGALPVAPATPRERGPFGEPLDELPFLPASAVGSVFGAYAFVRDKFISWEGRYVFLVGLFVALLGLDVQGMRVYLLWCAFFGPFAASLLVTRLYRFPVHVERELPRTTEAGAPVSFRVLVRNDGRSTLRGLHVREEYLPRSVRHAHHRGVVAMLPPVAPGEVGAARVNLVFERRGVYVLPRVRVERFCPFGLMRGGRTFKQREQVVVYPRTCPIERVVLRAATMHQAGGVPLASSVGESTEFIGLRDYRPGDPMRNLSWKAWARLQRPAVREFQSEYFKRVALVLDTHLDQPVRRRQDFEDAVVACASLARHFEANEYVVDLFAAGPDLYYLQAGRGLARIEDVLDVLALVEPGRAEPFPRLDVPLRELLGRLSAVVVVATDWAERHRDFAASLRGLVPEVKPVVVRRGAPTLDPGLDLEDPTVARVLDAARLDEELLIV